MRVRLAFVTLAAMVAMPGMLRAQIASGQAASGQTATAQGPQGAQQKQQQFYVQDGGTRETLESIAITPKAGAPFTLTLQTEAVRTLYDGGTVTMVNQRKIA